MVVEEALGDVQDPLPRHVDRRERRIEVAVARLVGTHLLGSDDPVERHAEAAVRGREQVVVAVRDDAEAEAFLEPPQGVGAVSNAGQSPTEPPNAASSSSLGVDSQAGRHATGGAGEHLAVAQVRAVLEGRLLLAYASSSSSSVRRLGPEEGPEPAAIPVSQSMSVP